MVRRGYILKIEQVEVAANMVSDIRNKKGQWKTQVFFGGINLKGQSHHLPNSQEDYKRNRFMVISEDFSRLLNSEPSQSST